MRFDTSNSSRLDFVFLATENTEFTEKEISDTPSGMSLFWHNRKFTAIRQIPISVSTVNSVARSRIP